MVIAICDDDKKYLERELLICQKVMGMENEFLLFSEGQELLECPHAIDLLILDIEMPGMSGIEIKDKIQNNGKNADTIIIFVTNYREYMPEAFGIHVLGFVLKEALEIQLSQMLGTACQMLKKGIMLDRYNSRDVMFIKTEHNYGKLLLHNGEMHLVRMTMKELEKKLVEHDFIRIHREYLVNMTWIERMGEDWVQVGGDKLPIATRARGKVKKEYKDYGKRNARYC